MSYQQHGNIETNLSVKPHFRASEYTGAHRGHGGAAGDPTSAHRPGSLRAYVVERTPTEGRHQQTSPSAKTAVFCEYPEFQKIGARMQILVMPLHTSETEKWALERCYPMYVTMPV